MSPTCTNFTSFHPVRNNKMHYALERLMKTYSLVEKLLIQHLSECNVCIIINAVLDVTP